MTNLIGWGMTVFSGVAHLLIHYSTIRPTQPVAVGKA
jgi:hypothetical protein